MHTCSWCTPFHPPLLAVKASTKCLCTAWCFPENPGGFLQVTENWQDSLHDAALERSEWDFLGTGLQSMSASFGRLHLVLFIFSATIKNSSAVVGVALQTRNNETFVWAPWHWVSDATRDFHHWKPKTDFWAFVLSWCWSCCPKRQWNSRKNWITALFLC